jgi:hypothetical protein
LGFHRRKSKFSAQSVHFDAFLREFRFIVSLAKEVAKNTSLHDRKYAFDQGLVYPLYLVTKWCRDGAIRREALKLLKDSARREGFYNGLLMGKTQEWVMHIEEEGIVMGGFIPQERRVRVNGVQIDSAKRTATVTAVRGEKGSEWDERVTVLAW